ncbi:MAG TPA: twin-arginine translocation signal domain-containing protein [Tepidisphaeraceae bacterium]|jgi:alpha-mannosidase
MNFREVSRREVLKAAAAAGVAAASSAAWGEERERAGTDPQAATTEPERVFCYVDGYHGGVDGHMPPASLRNVLDGLDKVPRWKVSFEIEPYSWAVFAKSDPESIERLRRFLADATPAGRVEIVSGAYGQAYMWNASGECNIRQIAHGLAELRAVFPDLVVDTYAVQEPCWTSCLPQILKSFGYRRAVLKNSTCWGGYHAPTLDADLVHWVGPDGTGITTVPRYAIEQLVAPATMAGAQPTTAFIDRCLAAGIEHPAGTILQDMGWPGRPWRLGMSQEVFSALRHVTWREYVDTIASPARKEWKASQEDLRVGLPWGASVLQRIAQIVRASENRLVQAEKIASMAFVRRGRPFPDDDLRQAWKDLLWSQHHDVWIVSQNRHRGGTWATAADAKAESIERTCARAVGEAAAALGTGRDQQDAAPGGGALPRFVRVCNTTGFRRRDLASVEVAAGETRRVLDAQGAEVACQVLPGPSGGASGAATLLFPADVPALGYATYQITPAGDRPASVQRGPAGAQTKGDGTIELDTDHFSIAIDPAKGGRIRSLFARDLDREVVDASGPRSFNEFRGYFASEGKWLSSADGPAEVSIVEQGPLRVATEIRGHIGQWPFVTRMTAAAGCRRIDFETRFEFPVDAAPAGRGRGQPADRRFRLGEPWESSHDTVRSNRRPFYDSSFKLQALFPAALRRPTLDKNAPFDVCRGTTADTQFNAWDAIKNNVIFNWVDLLEEGGAAGLAVMSDHVTAYSQTPGEPLGLVMCYAGRGIWHDYGLNHVPSVRYSLVPHAGDWAKARLGQELARWGEPLVAARCGAPATEDSQWSLLDAAESGVEVSTVLVEDGRVLVRLFNAEGDAVPKRLLVDGRVRRARLVELDGRPITDLPVERAANGKCAVTLSMPRFAVRTLQCEFAKGV